MAKGLFGGMTDYNHQSLTDILNDLEAEQVRTASFREAIQKNVKELITNGYWENPVPGDFKNIVAYAIHHYDTTISELDDIRKGLLVEVKEHHIKRLQKISNVAQEINVDIGKVWHQQYYNKDYGNKRFRTVETIYGDTRDMAVNLLDTANIAERLQDFIGRTNPITAQPEKRKWERQHKIGLASLMVAVFILFFGNNLCNRVKLSKPSISADSLKVNQLISDTTLSKIELPYLANFPIIDKGIYIKYYYNTLMFGGVNVDTIQINARAISSETIELKKEKGVVSMDITKEPYIEFEYKGKFYSIELSGKHYTFTMILKKIANPTMTLRKYSQL